MHTRFMLLALATLAACDEEKDTGEDIGCSTEAVASVMLTVEDTDGNSISDYTASYSVDGGAPQSCEDYGVCGYEVAGDFSIVVDAVGYSEATAEATIAAGTCHVQTEQVTVALGPVDCTTEVVASLIVTVLDEEDQPIDGAEVSYAAEDASGSCFSGEDALSHVFTCGEDVIGELEITVSADGFEPHTEPVEVSGDEEHCHPITEEHTVNLSPS